MDNLDLKTLSAKLSCVQMTEKAKDEINYYNNRFNNIMTPSKCIDNYTNTNNFNDEDDNYTNNFNDKDDNNTNKKPNTNIGYLPYLTINKKTCIIKKDFYNDGKWLKQFNDNLTTNDVFFDRQTRNKVNKLPVLCKNNI